MSFEPLTPFTFYCACGDHLRGTVSDQAAIEKINAAFRQAHDGLTCRKVQRGDWERIRARQRRADQGEGGQR